MLQHGNGSLRFGNRPPPSTHSSPSKLSLLNTPPRLIQTLSFTYKRPIPSPKKPAFSRDTTDRPRPDVCSYPLFAERRNSGTSISSAPKVMPESRSQLSCLLHSSLSQQQPLSLAPGERLVILCLFNPSPHSPGPRTTIRV